MGRVYGIRPSMSARESWSLVAGLVFKYCRVGGNINISYHTRFFHPVMVLYYFWRKLGGSVALRTQGSNADLLLNVIHSSGDSPPL